MATLTAYSSFDSNDGDDLDAGSASIFDEYYSDSSIEFTLYLEDADIYLTYAMTGDFYYSGGRWSGTVTKFEFYVNYAKYYSFTGKHDLASVNGLYVLQEPYAGDDIFVGSDENDYFVFDNAGTDKFFGNDGNDYISTNAGKKGAANGGAGNDFIIANGKGETLTGGDGSDTFKIFGGNQKQIITDFDQSADLVELALTTTQAKMSADLYAEDELPYLKPYASQIAVGSGYKSAKDADDLFAYDLKTGNLYFDKDGAGGTKAVQIANFKDKIQFTADELASGCLIISIVGSQDYSGTADDFLSDNEYGSM